MKSSAPEKKKKPQKKKSQQKMRFNNASYNYDQLMVISQNYTSRQVPVTEIEFKRSQIVGVPGFMLNDKIRLTMVDGRYHVMSGHLALAKTPGVNWKKEEKNPDIAVTAIVYSAKTLETVRIPEVLVPSTLPTALEKLASNDCFKVRPVVVRKKQPLTIEALSQALNG